MQSILKISVAVFRAARLVVHLSYGLMLAVAYPWFSLKLRRQILQRWSACLLQVLNVRVALATKDGQQLQSGLIVSNHISWLDVFVLNSVIPMRFVAKSEVRAWPVIGWLCARAQTLFIQRGKVRSASRVNKNMSELLVLGESLAVFPEGTTTNGAQLAQFHSSLMQPAIDAGVSVLPVALRYQDTNGTRSDAVAYVDEVSLGQSIWRILCTRQLNVRLMLTPPLSATEMNRRELTRAAHQQISVALEAMHLSSTLPLCVAQRAELSSARAGVDQHIQSLYCVLLYTTLSHEEWPHHAE